VYSIINLNKRVEMEVKIEEKLEIVLSLLKLGLSDDFIMQSTSLKS